MLQPDIIGWCFPRDRVAEEFREDLTVGHASRFGPEIKMEEVAPR